jgi:hypothetical protein
MANCNAVVQAYTALSRSLSDLAGRATVQQQREILRHRSMIAGELAALCDEKFRGKDVPNGDEAMGEATSAKQLADQADGTDPAAVNNVVLAANQANETLHEVLYPAIRRTFAGGLRGALRVAPQPLPVAGAGPQVSGLQSRVLVPQDTIAARKEAQPPYVASVALLFPIEAATLFPLGKSIADANPFALATIIALIVGFIIALRYFATQQEGGGPPAVKEIIIAVASFLLWVGALGGYWVPDPRGIDWGISEDLGAKLYGFAIIMWVAIVPYFVRKPAAPANP